MGSHSLLHGIFPTQGSNPCLLHCRQIFYRLSHQEAKKIEKEEAQWSLFEHNMVLYRENPKEFTKKIRTNNGV